MHQLVPLLAEHGLPDQFINMVTRLHADAVVNFKLGNEEVEVKNRIGVRQGACEGPVLFIFIMAAAMETIEWPVAKPTFRSLQPIIIFTESAPIESEMRLLLNSLRLSLLTIAPSSSSRTGTWSSAWIICTNIS